MLAFGCMCQFPCVFSYAIVIPGSFYGSVLVFFGLLYFTISYQNPRTAALISTKISNSTPKMNGVVSLSYVQCMMQLKFLLLER